MYHGIAGWGWLWVTFMMALWVVLFGAVVYAAVRLVNRLPADPKSQA